MSRLRRGEIIATLSAAVLVVVVFAVPWLSLSVTGGGDTHANGWTSLPALRWPIVVIAGLGLLLGYLQATRSAPALPVALAMVVMTVSAIVTIVLLIRLLTGAGTPLAGGFIGLVACAGVTAGAFMSLRQEQGWDATPPNPERPVETINLSGAGSSP
ncbi:MAG TPA: hypothetical protein VMF14_22705 [Solirubrobacteraceae bacterium]|nr:hypothetical protein [Solirubrobacteraceae bacterium]